MCGRTTITKTKAELEARWQAKMKADFKPNFNAAPAQRLPIIRNISPTTIELAKWGLLPAWLKGKRKSGFINAKAETIFDKPAFKENIGHKRCLVVVDGFYEWSHAGEKKPYRITLKNGGLFALAGLWDDFLESGEGVVTFSIITTEADELISRLHFRMPVILPIQSEGLWLNPKTHLLNIKHLLRPYPAKELTMYPVTARINNFRFNQPEAIDRVT